MCTNLYLISVMKDSFIVIVPYMLIIQAVLMNILTGDYAKVWFPQDKK